MFGLLVAQRESESLKNFRSIVRFYSNPKQRKSKYEKRSKIWRFLKRMYHYLRPYVFGMLFFSVIYFIFTTNVSIGRLSGFPATFSIISFFLIVNGYLGFLRRAGKSKFIRDRSRELQIIFTFFFFMLYAYIIYKEFTIFGTSTILEIEFMNFKIIRTFWTKDSLWKFFCKMCVDLALDPNGFSELLVLKNSKNPEELREKLIGLKSSGKDWNLKGKIDRIMQLYSFMMDCIRIFNTVLNIVKSIISIFRRDDNK